LRETGDPGFEPATLASIVTAFRLSGLVEMASQLNAIEVSLSDLKWSS
jgi:hypothetical protein